MTQRFRLFWLRDAERDLGRPVEIEDLDPTIRDRVAELAAQDPGPLTVQLPFFDRRDSCRRAAILRQLCFVREGDIIRTLPTTANAGIRDAAAALIATDPAWSRTPAAEDVNCFRTWQRVSLALQKGLRQWVPEIYFEDVAAFEDRAAAYPLLVYGASRVYPGCPRTEFTYDIAHPRTIECATHMIGLPLRRLLEGVERRLLEAGRRELARRYAPVWHEDITRAVQARPQPLLGLLADEAALINAVIELGSARGMEGVKPFSKAASLALRTMAGRDLRALAFRALAEATGALKEKTVKRTA